MIFFNEFNEFVVLHAQKDCWMLNKNDTYRKSLATWVDIGLVWYSACYYTAGVCRYDHIYTFDNTGRDWRHQTAMTESSEYARMHCAVRSASPLRPLDNLQSRDTGNRTHDVSSSELTVNKYNLQSSNDNLFV